MRFIVPLDIDHVWTPYWTCWSVWFKNRFFQSLTRPTVLMRTNMI